MIFLVLPDQADDPGLVARASRGDQRAVIAIYDRYFQPIYQYLRLRTDDAALSEDLAGSVFLKLIRALRGDQAPHTHLRGWLLAVARAELAQHFGRRQPFNVVALEEWMPAPKENEPEPQTMRHLEIERARAALRSLSPEQQEVIVLRFGQALSLEETADIMGKSPAAVKSLQVRALKSLRATLVEPRPLEGKRS